MTPKVPIQITKLKVVPKVRGFEAHEWVAYRDLRLAALAESPDAFGSTLSRESQLSDAEWASRLASGVNSALNFPAVAEFDNKPIGLSWGRIEESEPALAHLYQVWVHPDYRGLGAGKMLLEAVVGWAAGRQANYLELGVTCGDTAAMRLYTRAGFELIGEPEPIRPGSEVLSQSMRLRLRRPTGE